MNLPELCIRRPVMTTLLMATFLIFGLFAFKQLPVAALPRVDFPTINVSARLPGASPETMASSVAAPLEREFASISGITSMSSVSQQGSTSITLQFDLNRNIDGAALDVQAALSATVRRLPPELPAPPSFRKVNPADQPVLFMVLTSATKPLYEVHEFGENILQQQISQLPGVAQVNIFGAQKYAVRVRVNPDAVSARGLSLADVRAAIAAANSNSPVGTLNGANQRLTLGATGQMERAGEYGNLIISQKNGVPIRLNDVAQIYDSVENDQTGSWYNGQRSIMLAVYRQSDANTVQVVDAIKGKLDAYRAQLPAAIDLVVLNDRSIPIREAVEDVEVSLMIAIALVIMVIFLFLKSFAATVIPTLALPISLVGTFAIMYALGYSLDNISLLALTLAVGFVVDDAIVMLENIIRHIEMGKKPFQAALDGSRQIATIFTPATDYQVIMEAERAYQQDPAVLSRLMLKAANGQNVPLETVATIKPSVGPLAVNRISQQPAVTISFNTAPGVSLGDAVNAIRAAEREINLPASIVTSFAGSAQLFQDALKGQGLLIFAAILVIYIILGILYESFIHPITILSGLPSAGLGALLALQYFHMDLSVIAIIGILMLVGIVKKNAIMMVDFAIERRKMGDDALTAIRDAALVRFRPIMMTSFAAIFGVLPIALGAGAGAELRQPLGIAVVGGLVVSQLLTLYITPVVYFYLDKVDSFISGRGRGEREEAASVPGAVPVAIPQVVHRQSD